MKFMKYLDHFLWDFKNCLLLLLPKLPSAILTIVNIESMKLLTCIISNEKLPRMVVGLIYFSDPSLYQRLRKKIRGVFVYNLKLNRAYFTFLWEDIPILNQNVNSRREFQNLWPLFTIGWRVSGEQWNLAVFSGRITQRDRGQPTNKNLFGML